MITVSTVLLLSLAVIGQARDGTPEFQKFRKAETVLAINLPYAPEVVIKAFKAYLLKNSYNEQLRAKNYLLSANTALIKTNPDFDLIFEVTEKNSTEPDQSIVYFNMNPTPVQRMDYNVSSNPDYNKDEVLSYLNNLAVAIQPYAKDLQMDLQVRSLDKSERSVAKLEKQAADLNIIKANILQRLSEVINDQAKAKLLQKQSDNNEGIRINLAAQKVELINRAYQKNAVAILKLNR